MMQELNLRAMEALLGKNSSETTFDRWKRNAEETAALTSLSDEIHEEICRFNEPVILV